MLFQGFVWQPGAKFEYIETKRGVILLNTGNVNIGIYGNGSYNRT